MRHIPVLSTEILSWLDLPNRKTIIDATLGLGGHAELILTNKTFKGQVIGIDCDEKHLAFAKERLKPFFSRASFFHLNFADLENFLQQKKIRFDGILFDLGVASSHLDQASRGFSFQEDGPLDMRMDLRQNLTAEKIVNTFSEKMLANIFKNFGEERFAKKIARMIVQKRRFSQITRTKTLSTIIHDVYEKAGIRNLKISPATKCFQALRIAINDELNNLKKGLSAAIDRIDEKGRILTISYHSLEDRIVKQAFKKSEHPCSCPPKVFHCTCGKKPIVRILTKKPITPSKEELAENVRSRSAKLRVAEKIKT